MARRVTRSAAHLLVSREDEPQSPLRVTRSAAHVLTSRASEPVSPLRVTRAALHALVSSAETPVGPTVPLGVFESVTESDTALNLTFVGEPAEFVVATEVSAQALVESTAVDVRFSQLAAEVANHSGDEVRVSQLAAEVLLRPEVDCPTYPVIYRFRVRNAADTADLISVTSYREDGIGALIASEPTIDGATFDPLTGKVSIGAATIQVIDATSEPCVDPLDESSRIVTSVLLDANGETQLLGRKAFLEISRTLDAASYQPHFAGFVSTISLVDGITYEFNVSHTTRDDETTAIFGPDDARITARSFVLGGPVDSVEGVPSAHPSVLASKDQGFWRATVIGVYDTFIHVDIDEDASDCFPPSDLSGTLADKGWIILSNNDFQRNVFAWANRNMQKYFVRGYPSERTKDEWTANPTGKPPIRGYFPRVGIDVIAVNGMLPPFGFQRVTPMATYSATLSLPSGQRVVDSACWEDLGNHFYLAWGDDALNPQPSVGAQLTFRARPLDASEAAPRWVVAHPAVVLQRALESAGYAVNAASVTAAQSALGPILVALRLTEPQIVAKFIEMICGAFGMGVRVNPTGERVVFVWRTQSSPVDTITIDDVYGQSALWWRTDEASQIFSVQWAFQRFVTWPGDEGRDALQTDRAFDGVVAYDEAPIAFRSGTTRPSQSREQSYSVPGCLLSPDGSAISDVVAVTATWADQIFSVFANGAVTTELDVTHEVAADIGDEVQLELAPRPALSGTVGSGVPLRGAPERALIVGRTPYSWGSRLTLLRSPARASATSGGGTPEPDPSTVLDDSFSLSLGADPTSDVVLTIDDDTGWAASGVSLQINYAVQSSAPDPFGVWFNWLSLWSPAAPLTVGPFTPGTTVWFRVRKWFGNGVVGPYTAFSAVTLAAGVSSAAVGTVQMPAIFATLDTSTGVVDAAIVAGREATTVYVAMQRDTPPSAADILDGQTTTGSSPFSFPDLTDTSGVGPLLPGDTAFIGAIVEDELGNQSIPSVTETSFPLPQSTVEAALVYQLDASPDLLEAGDSQDVVLPFACQVVGWTILSPVSGSVTLDVQVVPSASYPPTSGDSVVGTSPLVLSSDFVASGDASLWDEDTFASGDVVRVAVDTADVAAITVTLRVRRL